MVQYIEKLYKTKDKKYQSFIIGADIGGTNTNIGVFGLSDNQPFLLRSLHYKSREITDFSILFAEIIQYLETINIHIKKICIAAAGVVHDNRETVKPTNLTITINANDIKKATKNNTVLLANDFEVIRHGIKHVANDMLIEVKKGNAEPNGHQAIMGAGTGLGKCIILESCTLVSEGGHADFAAQTKKDLDLITFIQKRENRSSPISWEDVLSGNGIERIYQFFLLECKGYCDVHGPHPDEIFAQRHTNEAAQKTAQYYAELYARCVRNFALEALSLGGLYIAGGIAARNVALFQTNWFLKTFTQNQKQQNILVHIPITLIADYNVSLYGAAEFLLNT